MKTGISNSAKRALSLVLAFAMLVGCLFTANVGVNINASALDVSSLTISYWNKDFEVQSNGFDVTSTSYINDTGAKGTTADDPIIIDDAKELATLVRYGNYQSTAGYFFKLSDKLDVIILQPENVVDAAELMSLSSGTATKEFFDNHANKAQFADWGALCDNGSFAGNFDGNGVEIYGLWMDPTANSGYGRQHGGLFGATDPGVIGSIRYDLTGGSYTYNDAGVTYQNIIIKNSYYFGYRRMGAIIPSTNGKNYGCSASGVYNIKNCIVANCYMECTGSKGDRDTNNNNTLISYGVEANGILMGSSDTEDVPIVTNCLAYGNKANNNVTTYWPESTKTPGSFCLVGQVNTYTNTSGVLVDTSISNSVSLDSPGCIYNHRTQENYCTNVYSTANYYSTPGVTSMYDEETLKGATAMAWASALKWGTDWFAVEGEYPTPIKPATYIPVSEKPDSLYESGDGTKESPYIIRTVDQLYQMVNEESYSGTYTDTLYDYATSADKSITSYYSKYYKVADGVKALYINDVDTQAEVKALAESGSCNKWAPTESIFAGNFDGNGVTIYGMVSTTGKGFVNKIDGTHAAIKNVHFKAAYVKGNSRAAVVTTDFGSHGIGYKATEDTTATTYFNREFDPNGEEVNDLLIANIAVTESYIETTLSDDNVATAGGIITIAGTPQWLTVKNCLFDGVSSTLIDVSATTAGASTASMKAGIASITAATITNRWEFANCVSINEYPVSMKSGGSYGRFDAISSGGSCEISTMYGPVNSDIDLTAYPKFGAVIALETKNAYTANDTPLLDWANTWEIVDVEFDDEGNATRSIPMPTGLAKSGDGVSYSQLIAEQYNSIGANMNSGVSGYKGKYGMQHKLTGSGTAEDPYLITNALELARAIACGGRGVNNMQTQYYKLTCDIDVSGYTWIDQVSISDNYHYVPFAGTIDGAGHTITGLAATDTTAAGFIPVLDGGTVKNLHFRDCYAGSSGVAGIIAGQVNSGTITGCSVEGSTTVGTSNHITGSDATITDSYYLVDGEAKYIGADTSDLYSSDNTDAVWYKVGDDIARHTSFAKAHSIADVDGDGVVEEKYVGNDIIALRNYLLNEDGYGNIYGDVNNDSVINISDLVVLRRQVVDTYNTLKDGFWRNVEIGKVNIYYGENDNYDAARKLELHLESVVPGVDIKKVVVSDSVAWGANSASSGTYVHNDNIAVLSSGTFRADNTNEKGYVQLEDEDQIAKYALDGNLQIVVGDIGTEYAYESTVDYDKYEVTFDATNMALWVKGGSFTAVEQAVLDLIATDAFENRSDLAKADLPSGSILTLEKGAYESDDSEGETNEKKDYKKAVKVGDTTYYYAWGDEFEGDNTTFNSDNWEIRNYKYEPVNDVAATSAEAGDTAYLNLESPTIDSIDDLWQVNNGKLTIWRGINTNASTYVSGDYSWGYKNVEQPAAGETNDFGREIDSDDLYVDPGLIQSAKSMLFKQGYAEMRASLPSDGHAFPAWWFYNGIEEKNNLQFENKLYSKVYKLNSSWNNATSIVPSADASSLNNYKYQVPKAFLEFDIVEFMEAQSGEGSAVKTGGTTIKPIYTQTGLTTGNYLSYPQLTIHKNYGAHATANSTDGYIHIPDWSTGTIANSIAYSDFGNTAGSVSFNHNYDHSAFTYNADTKVTKSGSLVNGAYNISGGITKTWTYGFAWTVDEANQKYELKIYVDFDQDGTMEDDAGELVITVDQTMGHPSKNSDGVTINDPVRSNMADECAVWNQYAYMLIDNAFYTSNSKGSRTKTGTGGTYSDWTGVTPFTDLEAQGTSSAYSTSYADKATFDIEYVRVYQENGKRDIVTPETEDFNNGNHFGY